MGGVALSLLAGLFGFLLAVTLREQPGVEGGPVEVLFFHVVVAGVATIALLATLLLRCLLIVVLASDERSRPLPRDASSAGKPWQPRIKVVAPAFLVLFFLTRYLELGSGAHLALFIFALLILVFSARAWIILVAQRRGVEHTVLWTLFLLFPTALCFPFAIPTTVLPIATLALVLGAALADSLLLALVARAWRDKPIPAEASGPPSTESEQLYS